MTLLAALVAVGVLATQAMANTIEAPFWNIGGNRLGSGETKATSIHNPTGTFVILHGTLKNEAIEIRCEKDEFGTLLEGSSGKHDGRSSGTIELSKCKLFNKEGKEQPQCAVATIKTTMLGGRLWLEGTKEAGGNRIVIVFKPLSGELFAEVVISNAECSYSGTFDLEGNVAANTEPEKEEEKFSKFIFPVTPIQHVWQPPLQTAEEAVSLKFNGTKASLQGEQEVELQAKEGFSEFAPHETREFVIPGGTLPAKVEGTSLKSTLQTEIAKTKVVITCKKDKLKGEVEKEGKSKGTLTLEECEIEGQPNCAVPNIESKITDRLVGTLVSEDEFKPETGSEVFVEVAINNKEEKTCLLKGKYPVKGTQICKLPRGEVPTATHEIKCTLAGSKLKIGESTATLESTETVKLESKKEWAAF